MNQAQRHRETMGPIRLGLIGYGDRGREMFQLAASVEGIRPVAVCDRQDSLRERACKEFPGAAVFAEFTQMLDASRLDALLVETPATLHAQFCCEALSRGIHVLSDVPAVETVEQGDALFRAARESRAIYMIGANPNMWGFVDAFVDLKNRGALGAVYYAEAEYIHDCRHLFEATPWRATYEGIRYCTHSLGPILRVIDEDLEWVSCFDTGSHIHRRPGEHDAMVAIFRTASNVVVKVLVSFQNCCPDAEHRYRLFCDGGYCERTGGHGGKQRLLYHSVSEPNAQDSCMATFRG